MKAKCYRLLFTMVFFFVLLWALPPMASAASSESTTTSNSVLAAPKANGSKLSKAKKAAKTSFTLGDTIYAWSYLHDKNGRLYSKYAKKACNIELTIYRPNGKKAAGKTFKKKDNAKLKVTLDTPGIWKIESKVTGAIKKTTSMNILVSPKPAAKKTTIEVFASPYGKGNPWQYPRSQAKTTFTDGDYIYIWGLLIAEDGSTYSQYGKGNWTMKITLFRPDGTVKYTYSYKNSDNNWIGCTLNQVGTWKIQCEVSGSISGKATKNITVVAKKRTTRLGVFTSYKGDGYTVQQALSNKGGTYVAGENISCWGYVHDDNGKLFRSYDSRSFTIKIFVYRPSGSLAISRSFTNKDNAYVKFKIDKSGTWTVKCTLTIGSSSTTASTTFYAQPERKTFLSVFTSKKGPGYELKDANSSNTNHFNSGDTVYIWAVLHDYDGNVYKTYAPANCKIALYLYDPSGAVVRQYSAEDISWVRMGYKVQRLGKWSVRCQVTGYLSMGFTKEFEVDVAG